ncbi:MAG: 4Fe-4S dicluster domain-containing protein, partial [Bacteroidales bacterium]
IRCSACINTCPVYRRSGGLSYEATYMGPIGIVLEPSYDLHLYAQLPYSCTHCGSCGNVCPVHVPLPSLIFRWRNILVDKKEDLLVHRFQMDTAAIALKNEFRLSWAEKFALSALRNIPSRVLNSKLNDWAINHTNPAPPEETFREFYTKQEKQTKSKLDQ